MRAVCRAHHTCSKTHGCRTGRPIGELRAWLEFGSRPGVSRDQHRVHAPGFDVRQAARLDLLALGGSDEFFAAEASEAPGGPALEWKTEADCKSDCVSCLCSNDCKGSQARKAHGLAPTNLYKRLCASVFVHLVFLTHLGFVVVQKLDVEDVEARYQE